MARFVRCTLPDKRVLGKAIVAAMVELPVPEVMPCCDVVITQTPRTVSGRTQRDESQAGINRG